MNCNITFLLNERWVTYTGNPSSRLLDVLRGEFELTEVKCGCLQGQCGACSVIIDGKLRNSCLVAMGSLHGADIVTIEGFRETSRFAVLNDAYASASAVQCGYCTPGMILACECLLRNNADPSEDEIRDAISGNLCKCAGYDSIVKAIGIAAKNIKATDDNEDKLATGYFAEYNIIADNIAAADDTAVLSPTTLKEALLLRKDPDLIPYSGGTNIMAGELNNTGNFLFLSQIPELKQITEDENYIRFGSACTFAEVIRHELTPGILKQMCRQIAGPAVRNAGTLGGNIANGSAKSDSTLIFMVTDSKLRIASADGQRTVPIKDFYLDDGSLDIEPDELIVEILMPRRGLGNYSINKSGPGNAFAQSYVSFAGLADTKDGIISNFAVAFGALGEKIIRLPGIDRMLIGKTIVEAKSLKADYLAAYNAAITPRPDIVNAEHCKAVSMELLEEFFDNMIVS